MWIRIDVGIHLPCISIPSKIRKPWWKFPIYPHHACRSKNRHRAIHKCTGGVVDRKSLFVLWTWLISMCILNHHTFYNIPNNAYKQKPSALARSLNPRSITSRRITSKLHPHSRRRPTIIMTLCLYTCVKLFSASANRIITTTKKNAKRARVLLYSYL